jgi:hypothetical protein
MQRPATATLFLTVFGPALGACGARAPQPDLHYPELPPARLAAQTALDRESLKGGRLYANFVREQGLDFTPDDPKTPEPDGKGGPFGNGTLPDAEGKPMLNPGHDYLLKNLLGWDLHGAAGISGTHKAHGVLLPDLLTNTDARSVWLARLEHGEDAIPAYGSVLGAAELEALVDFVLGIRDGRLPQPDDLFTLAPEAPGAYTLKPGADVARGQALIAARCAGCHGEAGEELALGGDAATLGTFLRTRASEAWLAILAGAPGTKMGPQLSPALSREQLTNELRDILAAGCDRTRYPRAAEGGEDVSDGDPRCGAYLK